jgi:hypothetical protein
MQSSMTCRSCSVHTCGASSADRLLRHADGIVIVATDDELQDTVLLRRMAVALANLKLSRRKVPDWLADTLYFYEGQLRWPCNRPFSLGHNAVDESFGEEDSCWWFGAFMRCHDRPMKQRPQTRVLPRLRLLNAAFWIAFPDVARHFARKR